MPSGAAEDWQAMVSREPLRVAPVLLWLDADESSLWRTPQRAVWFLLPDHARRASHPLLPCSPAPWPPTAAARGSAPLTCPDRHGRACPGACGRPSSTRLLVCCQPALCAP